MKLEKYILSDLSAQKILTEEIKGYFKQKCSSSCKKFATDTLSSGRYAIGQGLPFSTIAQIPPRLQPTGMMSGKTHFFGKSSCCCIIKNEVKRKRYFDSQKFFENTFLGSI